MRMLAFQTFAGIATALLVNPPAAVAEEIQATVTRVSAANILEIEHDGETELVALYGVTAPSSSSLLGKQAKAFAEQRVLGKSLPVRVVSRQQGLTYVEIQLPNGRSLGHVMLRQGLVEWDSLSAPNDTGLRELEQLARSEERGLWSTEASSAVASPDRVGQFDSDDAIAPFPAPARSYPRAVETRIETGEEGEKTLVLRGNARKDLGYEASVERFRANAEIARMQEQQRIQQEMIQRQQEASRQAQLEQQRLAEQRAREQLEAENQRLLNERLRRQLSGEPLVIPLTRNRP